MNRIWMAVLAGPIAWLAVLLAGWTIAPAAQSVLLSDELVGRMALLRWLHVVAFIVCISALVVAAREVRRAGAAGVVAIAAVMVSVASIGLVGASAVPTLLLAR